MEKESLVGNRIGSLYILSQTDNRVYCYCSNCRNNVELSYIKAQYCIKHKKNITCGCTTQSEIKAKENLIDTRYNMLTIVKLKDNETAECRCDCGRLLEYKLIDLQNSKNAMCKQCNINYNRNKKCDTYLLSQRHYKELYYIWTSFKNLYELPTEDFQKKIIQNNIKFFPELGNKKNPFELFYQWAIVGCEQKYGESGKVALIRIDKQKDYSSDNCMWIYQDLDKDSFVKLGIYNIDNEKFNYDDVDVTEKNTYCCFNCLYKPKKDKKKSDEENYERCTHIYTEIVLNNDVKNKKTKGYYPYIYKNKYYHKECLLYHLRDTLNEETEVQEVYQKVLKGHNTENRKVGKLTADEMKNAIADREARDKLIQYLLGKYDIKQIPRLIMYDIDNLNNGTSNNYNNVYITYDKLLDMFLYYEDFLQKVNKKKKEKIVGKAELLAHNLACVVCMIDEYDSRNIAIYSKSYKQQDERGEILDVKKYRLDLQNKVNTKTEEVKILNGEMKRAEEFADEYTKEYDNKYDEELLKMFPELREDNEQ